MNLKASSLGVSSSTESRRKSQGLGISTAFVGATGDPYLIFFFHGQHSQIHHFVGGGEVGHDVANVAYLSGIGWFQVEALVALESSPLNLGNPGVADFLGDLFEVHFVLV